MKEMDYASIIKKRSISSGESNTQRGNFVDLVGSINEQDLKSIFKQNIGYCKFIRLGSKKGKTKQKQILVRT